MNRKIRIVSDLHIGHRASLIEHAKAIAPLADGVERLVFNGDTLELKYGDLESSHYNAAEQKSIFLEEVSKWGVETTLITGNHDPAISEVHSASLRDGAVFATHGDGLYKEIAPWSSSIKLLRACSKGIDENQTGRTAEDLHRYLSLHKQVSIKAHEMDETYNPTLWGKLRIFLHQAWPPDTPFRILKCWRETPDRAVSLAERFEIQAKFLIVGHTHKPGIWQRGDRYVINLGSYFPWPGAYCVDIADNLLEVKRVRKGRNRVTIGETIRSFEL
ncbi:metallophosphoesterase family protein [Pelagicoccus sp. SDUM812003]|uniref:metallophosphoesterase family protein n=1 Tax=Pelagicoccus sp. SDUM812003 TaxID=3041267 RepID=UPI00280C4EEE|nr:metallophosphoesterase family protein [Pelagicoccus sp. SDUM812003]MDQ8205573.1 metallophosphoesterase family protein [Pelagicoccus sp. SDUM812003]